MFICPFPVLIFFCNINVRGDDKNRLLMDKLVIIWISASMSSKQLYTVFGFIEKYLLYQSTLYLTLLGHPF